MYISTIFWKVHFAYVYEQNMVAVVVSSTHSHDPCYWGETDLPACGPPASFSVQLASKAVTPVGSVHKSRGDNVVSIYGRS